MPARRELTMRQLRQMFRLLHDGLGAREPSLLCGAWSARARAASFLPPLFPCSLEPMPPAARDRAGPALRL
jgi:hypothetical protein